MKRTKAAKKSNPPSISLLMWGIFLIVLGVLALGYYAWNSQRQIKQNPNDIKISIDASPEQAQNLVGKAFLLTKADACMDSDGGHNYLVSGFVAGIEGNTAYQLNDYCVVVPGVGTRLKEYYCSGQRQRPGWEYAECRCKNNACATDCTEDEDCGTGQFCEYVYGTCGGFGRCAQLPDDCANDWLPVCGCDQVTYRNNCARKAAGVAEWKEGSC